MPFLPDLSPDAALIDDLHNDTAQQDIQNAPPENVEYWIKEADK